MPETSPVSRNYPWAVPYPPIVARPADPDDQHHREMEAGKLQMEARAERARQQRDAFNVGEMWHHLAGALGL